MPPVAVVQLRGEQNVELSEELGRVLARACNQELVIVDLSGCTFIDSIVLNLLLATHRRQTKRGGRFELVIPPEAHEIDQLARLAEIDTRISIHETREAALASIQREP